MSAVHPLSEDQRQAVQPGRTVWLSASAGTGKTQVLVARVLRLLLEPGVEPDHILCLTFTKAGAAEMAVRVNDVLARWVRLTDDAIARDLLAIGADIDRDTIARARSRFAAVLDCPGGGLRIGTIHAFAQWLLGAFPVEAGLQPGSRAFEDRDRALLVRQVLAGMLLAAQESGDEALLDALAELSLRFSPATIEDFLLRCAGAQELWEGPGGWQPPLRPRINQVLGLAPDEDRQALAALCADDSFDCRSVRRCMEANARWGTKKGIEAANAMGDWLAATPGERLEQFESLALAFLRKDGGPRDSKNLLRHDPDYGELQARVIDGILAVRERLSLHDLAELVEPALAIGRRFAQAWDAAKAREGFIDFDDQIRRAAQLLTRGDAADWIRFKLDRRFDHILVDEAQDTNAEQWRIVLDGLIADFFSGEGQRGDVSRTLFVVGDYKQAIFRFQGTSPENFAAARERVRRQLDDLAGVTNDPATGLLDLGLGQSYRTARPILDFVDKAIRLIGPENFGLRDAPDPHLGEERPGLVTLWQPVSVEPAADEDADDGGDADGPAEAADEGNETWLSRPDRVVAEKLALQVKQWLDDGFPLQKGKHRLAGPGDVMVLVRKRKQLAGLIVARLHAAGVPVAGVDRLRLAAPLAVRDLMAVLRFCAQPGDDLNLAALLVSPLIGWTQEDLLAHGYRDSRVSLWAHLRATQSAATRPAMDLLLAALAKADYEPPAALLQWLLVGPWQGRKRLVGRLGGEASDPIDELLNAALAYGAANTASLVDFIRWFDAGEGELKRDAGRSEGLVRVMTVHGAKGLQAPIVILADAADDPDSSPPRSLEVVEEMLDSRRPVPLPPLRKAEKVGAVRAAEEEAKRLDREEHWRLLYVAMTRAEEALFVAGALGTRKTELPTDSWYARLEPLFGAAPAVADALWGARQEIGAHAPRPPVSEPVPPEPPAPLPAVLLQPIGPEPRPPRPLAPSSTGEADAADPPSLPGAAAMRAARRGTLLHRLIERLPELAPSAREAAALAWLARNGADFESDEQVAMARSAMDVIAHPEWQDVFGPGSLAEVPLAAVVEGRVVSGTVDRLLIGQDRVRIVDFKTARRPPADLAAIPVAYIRQMAAYVEAMRAIHPGVPIEAALLYTHVPRMFVLPRSLLAAHKLDNGGPQQSFAP